MSSSSANNNEGGRRGRRGDGGSSSGGRDTAYDWERKWREDVNRTLRMLTDQNQKSFRELSDQNQKTAIVIAGIMTRLETLEKRPNEARALFGVANQSLGSLLGIGALLVAIVSTLLQHVTFH